MNSIAALLRALNLLYHEAHHYVSGASFAGDHKMLGGFYEEVIEDFDDICEEALSIKDEDFNEREANKNGFKIYSESAIGFRTFLNVESRLQDALETGNKSAKKIGTQNLIQGIATKSSKRIYKIQQRLKSSGV